MNRLLGATALCGMALLGTTALSTAAKAAGTTVTLHAIGAEGVGDAVGTVTIGGGGGSPATFTTDLEGLSPGQHGFHIHAKGDCGPGPGPDGKVAPGMAAGGHWDPGNTGKHLGPKGEGHLGDLPVLEVAADGTAKETLEAPRITDTAQLKGHALMIHTGGDTYTDPPASGGGGARLACGVIE